MWSLTIAGRATDSKLVMHNLTGTSLGGDFSMFCQIFLPKSGSCRAGGATCSHVRDFIEWFMECFGSARSSMSLLSVTKCFSSSFKLKSSSKNWSIKHLKVWQSEPKKYFVFFCSNESGFPQESWLVFRYLCRCSNPLVVTNRKKSTISWALSSVFTQRSSFLNLVSQYWTFWS